VGDKAAEVLKKFHEFAATSIATPSLWCLKSFSSQALAIAIQAENAHAVMHGAMFMGPEPRALSSFFPPSFGSPHSASSLSSPSPSSSSSSSSSSLELPIG